VVGLAADVTLAAPDSSGASADPDAAGMPRDACLAACANVEALLRAEIGALDDDGRAILAGTQSARERGCLEGCVRSGDRDSVACATSARSLIELGGCEGPRPGAR
jgi:hypothetical protein